MRIFKENKKINIQKNSFKNLTSPYIKVRLQLYKEIPALGHDDGSWFIVKNADCTHTGSKHKYCSECGDTITEEIPKLEQKKNNTAIVIGLVMELFYFLY